MPQDARAVDIISGLSLLGVALQIVVFGYEGKEFLAIMVWPFWALLLSALSVLQIISIYLHPFAETLRSIVTGIAGLFWVYIFLVTCNEVGFSPLALFVGIGCLYSAIITALYVGQSWKS